MKRILLCTTNGVGLGHLTRSMAIAGRLPGDFEPVIFTLSQALPVVREQGFYAEFLPSAGYAGTDRAAWNLLYERRLGEVLDTYEPRVVTFDGAYPYTGFLAQHRHHRHRAFVWCRRGMWKPGRGAAGLARSRLFDVIIEPGEYAAEADRGLTAVRRRHTVRVAPMTLLDEAAILSRSAARRELGLDQEATIGLVQLGVGAVNDPSSELGIAVKGLRAGGVDVVVGESTIATRRHELPAGVRRLRAYPLLRVLRAFDLAVTAAGYNTFHESLAAGVPTIFVPNLETQLDDQLARAQWAEAMGLGRCWADGSQAAFSACLKDLLDPRVRDQMTERCRGLPRPTGAADAAAILVELAARRPW